MSLNIKNDQCYCTVMPCVEGPVGADPFCVACEGTGKAPVKLDLFQQLTKHINDKDAHQ